MMAQDDFAPPAPTGGPDMTGPGRPNLSFEGQQDLFNDRVIQFTNFLERDFKANPDQTVIKEMVKYNKNRLIVDIDNLRHYDRDLANSLLKHPMDYLPAFDRALKDIVISTYNPERARVMHDTQYHVGLKGAFGDHLVNPRSLSASNIGTMVALEGIITRCSLVRPKMVKSVHYCEATHLFHTREYRDSTMLSSDGSGLPSMGGTTYPTEDDQGNPLTTEFGYCTFIDHQTVSMQEMPERAPPGQLPRSVDVILDDDLVDTCKPGDRVLIVGVYRAVSGGTTTGTFRTVVIANHVTQLTRDIACPVLSATDVQNITALAQRPDIVDLLSRSLAPSIFGHDMVKRAILLFLLGGLEHNLDNGTHIRGDINVLLLGDPSTAKSQFLRFVMHIAPLAIATTGRGSSGVGLTAAVTHDKETGERRLEAGAMVLADRGVVCIDEFDKMSDVDRVAIHEVMEQQTITIAKAGIHTSLNARCSVIAAANPTYGQYDENLEPHRNIRLPDSLLSRFDLLFVILDKTDEAKDRKLASHVLRMHRYIPPGVEEGQPLPTSLLETQYQYMDHAAPDAPESVPVFEKAYARSAGPNPEDDDDDEDGGTMHRPRTRSRARQAGQELLSLAFLKKYIQFAKQRRHPVLTPEACQTITEAYTQLRNAKAQDNAQQRRTLPVTARTLETLIRLATAHAKARLSRHVTDEDARMATEILHFALFKEFHKKKRAAGPAKKKRRTDSDLHASDSDEGSDQDGDADGHAPAGATAPPPPAASDAMDVDMGDTQPSSMTSSQIHPGLSALLTSSQGVPTSDAAPAPVFDDNKFAVFRTRLDIIFQDFSGQANLSELSGLLNHARIAGDAPQRFSEPEMHMYLDRIEEMGGVFVDRDGMVAYRV